MSIESKKKSVLREPSTFLKRLFINTITFVLCYIAASLFYTLVTSLVCTLLGYEPHPTYNAILNLNKNYDYWSRTRIIVAFGTAPMLLFIIGFYFLVSLRYNLERATIPRYIALWFSIASTHLFLAQLIAIPAYHGSLKWGLYQGLSNIAAWFYLPFAATLIFSVLGVILNILYGFLISYRFIQFYMKNNVDESFKPKPTYYFELYFLPVILGSGPLLLLTNDFSFPLHCLILIVYFISGLGMLIKKDNAAVVNLDKYPDVYSKFTF